MVPAQTARWDRPFSGRSRGEQAPAGMKVMGTSGNIPDRVSETERTIRSGGKLLTWKTGVAKQPSSLGTMIFKKSLERSTGKCVAGQGDGSGNASLGSGPSPHTTTPSPDRGRATACFQKNQQKGRCV
jgi:hypothetical protein